MGASGSMSKSSTREIGSKGSMAFCRDDEKGILPGYYELRDNPGSQQLLASLSADVLKTGINDDHDTVGSTRISSPAP